ncbi:uncharacterized protein LOC132754950 [Ruditapes philippinarum]|uniref:uncharacterized protein LOC132754950 n=1 Tax=Ruditapes philippinarum TaxID=129788 RepID=UPI00295BD9E7|nr:uncharacterized protein LOC132754950 [Ruditapes philippinarum]
MECVSKLCAMPKCAGGRQPVSRPDQCCLVCPEVPKPRINCPSHVVHVNTSYYTNMTLLDDTKTSVAAFNHFGVNLQVNYRPAFVHHCKCDRPLDHVTTVEAYASDHYGNVATCSFQVAVRDIYAPVIFSCPEDVYVFEDEAVKWLEPNAADNVGVASKTYTSLRNGTRFPVGDHRITCNIHDFDGNMASCNFRVSVTRKDTPFDDMPIGLRERSTGEPELKLSAILPPIFGAIVLVVLALLLLFLCRRKCLPVISKKKPTKHPKTENIYAQPDDIWSTKSSLKSKRSSVSTYSSSVSSRSSAGRALAFHSNAHAVPGDIGVRPPPYSPYVGYSPPPYSVSGSVKDVMYMSMPVPAYHNPDYESLSVHMPSNSGRSVRSGSRSSKAGSTKSSRSSKSGSVKSTKSSSRA